MHPWKVNAWDVFDWWTGAFVDQLLEPLTQGVAAVLFINKNILVLLFASVKRFGVSVCKIFYPNFEPLYHLNHIKIFIEAFSQNCIYVKYLSFTTFVILVTVLGVEQFVSAYLPDPRERPAYTWLFNFHTFARLLVRSSVRL